MLHKALIISSLILINFSCFSQENISEEISIKDFAWLSGSWKGEGLGGELEEIWSTPDLGQMMGMFKYAKDGKVNFYELMLIVEEADGFKMKVKHFSADFTAWETKEEYVTFPLLKISPTEIRFDGLILQKISDDEAKFLLTMKTQDGDKQVEFNYKRVE